MSMVGNERHKLYVSSVLSPYPGKYLGLDYESLLHSLAFDFAKLSFPFCSHRITYFSRVTIPPFSFSIFVS